jgi:hypothetical protein
VGDTDVNRDQITALLRWYPRSWRERYGEELMALMEDQSGERAPTRSVKMSLVWAGLRERFHGSGLVGAQRSPAERARAGSLLVLCAWTAFTLAGASFSKGSEHFARAVPVGSRRVPQGAYDVVAALGAIGVTLVVLGAVAALPGFFGLSAAGDGPRFADTCSGQVC